MSRNQNYIKPSTRRLRSEIRGTGKMAKKPGRKRGSNLSGDSKELKKDVLNSKKRPNSTPKKIESDSVKKFKHNEFYQERADILHEEGIRPTRSKLNAKIKAERGTPANLVSLPKELIHDIFLMSGNWDLALCSKRLYADLGNSEYLAKGVVQRLLTVVSDKPMWELMGTSEFLCEPEDPYIPAEDIDEHGNRLSVLNAQYLKYRFVTADTLKGFNVRYVENLFPTANEDYVCKEDTKDTPMAEEFEDLPANERTIGLFLYLLSQPRSIKNDNSNASTLFLNKCIKAGYRKEVVEMLNSEKVDTDCNTLMLALDDDMALGDLNDLFQQTAKHVGCPCVFSSQIIRNQFNKVQNQNAIEILEELRKSSPKSGWPKVCGLNDGTDGHKK